ncbi:MAG: hypothetical protein M0R51_09510 [Clostridia bacterium]|jgi:hypothetical protein|nr:hypothetical protein [Clostridia bacterium]
MNDFKNTYIYTFFNDEIKQTIKILSKTQANAIKTLDKKTFGNAKIFDLINIEKHSIRLDNK